MNKIAIILIVLALGAATYIGYKQLNEVNFNVSTDQISKDLEGRSVALLYGQFWPFDNSQSLSVKIISVKKADDYYVAIIELSATAKVQQSDQKDAPKLPDRLSLSGLARVTYEKISGNWYLIGADNVSLRATPLE